MRSARSGPLTGVRILDLGRIMAAPWATQIFADLGADVIKIERPEGGDDTRAWGPPYAQDVEGHQTRESGYYLSVNRGKRSVTVDISSEAGQDVIHSLAKISDVVIENFRPGGLAKYRLDAESLQRKNPKLIYLSLTGFGQSGPRCHEAAYDFAIQGMGGLMGVTGERDDAPGGGPQKVGVPIIDLMTGMYASVAILAALYNRERTGEGEVIDLAMLDVSSALLSNQAMNFLIGNNVPKRRGNSHPNIQPQDIYPCADGHIVLAVGNDRQFVKLCSAVGLNELADDPRFSENVNRVKNVEILTAKLAATFSDYSRDALLKALGDAGVPAAPVNTVADVFEDPQIRHREMLRHLAHPTLGKVPQVVSPMRFQNAKLNFDRPPPLLGEHTDEVLAMLDIEFEAAS